ncbi:MAG: prolipoprotein diacylglyceryl transferase family protein [Chitinophagaceae bacterium]
MYRNHNPGTKTAIDKPYYIFCRLDWCSCSFHSSCYNWFDKPKCSTVPFCMYRHPAQLYEAIFYIIIFFTLWVIYHSKRTRLKKGFLFGLFLVLLFSVRFIIEFVKENQEPFENRLLNGLDERELIRFASALEQNSEHPIATGIMQKARDLSISIPSQQNFNAITGKGVEATVDGKQIKVVSPGYLKEKNIALPPDFNPDADETVVFVLINETLAGYISLSDQIRPESADAIKTLHDNNIKSVLLTGDNSKVAESVSNKLGIDTYYAEVLPHQKLEK